MEICPVLERSGGGGPQGRDVTVPTRQLHEGAEVVDFRIRVAEAEEDLLGHP